MSATPIELRVYGLEGITKTQDHAITIQAKTIAEQDETLQDHTIELAVHEQRLNAHDKSLETLVGLVNKVIWALVGFSLTIAGSAVAVAQAVN